MVQLFALCIYSYAGTAGASTPATLSVVFLRRFCCFMYCTFLCSQFPCSLAKIAPCVSALQCGHERILSLLQLSGSLVSCDCEERNTKTADGDSFKEDGL